jgi:hypothetical protein
MSLLSWVSLAVGSASILVSVAIALMAFGEGQGGLPLDLGEGGIAMALPLMLSFSASGLAAVGFRAKGRAAPASVALLSWVVMLAVFGVEGFFTLF